MSNTSTLVLLAKATLLEKFLGISPKIIIPQQVKDEYSFEKGSYYAKLIERLVEEKKIEVKEVDDRKLSIILQNFRLDKGEAAAYILYKSGNYSSMLTDDGELIKLCKLEKIPFLCALAIVIRMHERGVINKKEASEKLENLNKIGRYSREIYEYFKQYIGGV